jgi:DNA-directed RNA polymerase specialized sigma subunit
MIGEFRAAYFEDVANWLFEQRKLSHPEFREYWSKRVKNLSLGGMRRGEKRREEKAAKIARISEAERQLQSEIVRRPTNKQIAKRAGLPHDYVRKNRPRQVSQASR